MSVFASEFESLDGLNVHVDDVVYMPTLDVSPDLPHAFVYFITIINDSRQAVRIGGRKWVIRQNNGQILVVEGDDVVNQQPYIEPGKEFFFNSYHAVSDHSIVSGSFFGICEFNRRIMVPIPKFSLSIPQNTDEAPTRTS